MNKREWSMTNAGAVTAGDYWYPLSETGAPTDRDLDEHTPFRALTMENQSGEEMIIFLDPHPISSAKSWRVADGTALTIESDENISFHNVIVKSEGAVDTPASELKLFMRNY